MDHIRLVNSGLGTPGLKLSLQSLSGVESPFISAS